jgi:hypothetical protein
MMKNLLLITGLMIVFDCCHAQNLGDTIIACRNTVEYKIQGDLIKYIFVSKYKVIVLPDINSIVENSYYYDNKLSFSFNEPKINCYAIDSVLLDAHSYWSWEGNIHRLEYDEYYPLNLYAVKDSLVFAIYYPRSKKDTTMSEWEYEHHRKPYRDEYINERYYYKKSINDTLHQFVKYSPDGRTDTLLLKYRAIKTLNDYLQYLQDVGLYHLIEGQLLDKDKLKPRVIAAPKIEAIEQKEIIQLPKPKVVIKKKRRR